MSTQASNLEKPVARQGKSKSPEHRDSRVTFVDLDQILGRPPSTQSGRIHLSPHHVLQLQRVIGNQAVRRLLANGEIKGNGRQLIGTAASNQNSSDQSSVQRSSSKLQSTIALSASGEECEEETMWGTPLTAQQHGVQHDPMIQRMMVRMPNVYEFGIGHYVGDAEVDEIETSLEKKGKAGTGGKHGWEDTWVFPDREATYFYGHGNRAEIGGLEGKEFVAEVVKPDHNLQENTAMKFISCGGGMNQAQAVSAGDAYGDQVSQLLQDPTANWKGALKAAEGLVYYTEDYKTVIPEIPQAIEKLLKKLETEEDNNARNRLWKCIKEALLGENDKDQRLVHLKDLQTKVEGIYRSNSMDQEADAVAKASVDSQKPLSNKKLNKIGEFLDSMFKGVALLHIIVGFDNVDLDTSNPMKATLKNEAASVDSDLKNRAIEIWNEFKAKLKEEQDKIDPTVVKEKSTGGKIGTYDQPGGTGAAPQRFSSWENFGPEKWSDWKSRK